jgi:hypothetical protein
MMRTADLLKFLSDSDLQPGTVNVEPFNLEDTENNYEHFNSKAFRFSL